jgi:DNA modification methylase
MKVKTVKIEEVIPYVRNPRQNKDAIAKVSASLKEFGWQQPIVVDKDMVVIAGHTRLEAARTLGMDKVPVQIAQDLTDAQVKAYRIADNRVSQEAEWDLDLLKLELADLDNLDYDLLLTGFDDDELNGMLIEAVEEGFTDEDDVPELPDEPVSVSGDIWTLGNHRLMCGDSTSVNDFDKLMDGHKSDMIFTDPPYGMSYGGGRAAGSSKKGALVKAHGMIKNDDLQGDSLVQLVADAIYNSLSHTKEGAALYSCLTWRTYSEFEEALKQMEKEVKACIVWDKKSIGLGQANYRPQHEFIFYCGGQWYGDKKQSDVWYLSRGNTSDYVHPTQKPVELIELALENSSKAGDIVIDCFGGSGSTLIACEKKARGSRLMELDNKYADAIILRWQDFTGKEAVHAETGKTYNEMKAERDGGK